MQALWLRNNASARVESIKIHRASENCHLVRAEKMRVISFGVMVGVTAIGLVK